MLCRHPYNPDPMHAVTSSIDAPPAGSRLYAADVVREIDRRAIEDAGIPGYTLMTRAAEFAFEEARLRFPDVARCTVVCGSGNNAGDGYVLARLARTAGWQATVVAVTDADDLEGDAATAFDDCRAAGVPTNSWSGELPLDTDLVVDALLGSGLSRPLGGGIAAAVAAINERAAPVLALDVPSGIEADSGAALGSAVAADLTATFVARKIGLYVGEGRRAAGDVTFSDLGIPQAILETSSASYLVLPDAARRRLLAPRELTAHKGSFGHAVIVGGGPGMAGAARLAGEAALRAGAGVVSLVVHPDSASGLVAGRPELMVHGATDPATVAGLFERASVVAVGPGLGTGDWARSMYAAVSDLDLPLVQDADALNLLAERPRQVADAVLTPHPGEAARLLDVAASTVQSDRSAAIKRLQERFGGHVILKGSGTLVSSAFDCPWLCVNGNPGMAAPGMGDALTGIVAAFIAQGIPAADAAVLAVDVHARAGDRAAAAGERGMTAGDLIDALRAEVNP